MRRSLLLLLLIFFALAGYSQCSNGRQTYLPTPDRVHFNGYAKSIDAYGDYMVAGIDGNDSLNVDAGKAVVYQLNTSNQWTKVAELLPSDPVRGLKLGTFVAISENSIAITAEIYQNNTYLSKIYIYEKSSSDTWTTRTESYQILGTNTFGAIDMIGDELIATAIDKGKYLIKIFKKSDGVFSISQVINSPADKIGSTAYTAFAVSDSCLAIASDQFRNADNSLGIVFVFQKTGGLYSTAPTARLHCADQTSQDFGSNLTVNKNTVFVGSNFYKKTDGTYGYMLYIYEKPATGWIDAIATNNVLYDPFVFHDYGLTANDDYVFICGSSTRPIQGYKRTATDWSSGVVPFEIANSYHSEYGYHPKLNGSHLIVGVPGFEAEARGRERIVDFYSPDENWVSNSSLNQVLSEAEINASDDHFETTVVSGHYVMITAPNDDEGGQSAGCVYVYDKTKPDDKPKKILSPDPQVSALFGNAIAVYNNTLFISSVYFDSLQSDGQSAFFSMGKVYVYRQINDEWRYQSQILAPNIQNNIQFGQGIACTNGYVAISQFSKGSSSSQGSVHIYKENPSGKFLYIATVKSTFIYGGDLFGNHMIMNDSLLVVGTGGGEHYYESSVKVYLYNKKGEWKNATEDAQLSPTTKKLYDLFGASIAMDHNYIVVGSPEYSNNLGSATGTAYIFKRPSAGWQGTIRETAQLFPSDPSTNGEFGYSVSIDHDDIFVGSPHSIWLRWYSSQIDPNIKAGKIYHYVRNDREWSSTNKEKEQILSGTSKPWDTFGSSLYLADRTLYMSALYDDTEVGYQSGSVQTFIPSPTVEPVSTLCNDTSPILLKGYPLGGTWSGIGVNTLTNTFDPSLAGSGSHELTYAVSGCNVSTFATVVDSQVNITSQSDEDQMKCIDKNVFLIFDTNIDLSNYRWYFKVQEQESYQKIDSLKKQIEVNKPGYYKVELRNEFCLSVIKKFLVQNDESIDIQITPISTICSDENITLEATPIGGEWSGLNISATGTIDALHIENGPHHLLYSYTTPFGCPFNSSLDVTVDKLVQPEVNRIGDEVCVNSPVTLSLNEVDVGTTVQWFRKNGDEELISTVSEIDIKEPGEYFARVAKHDCSFETLPVKITALRDSLFVPNVFTPNTDTFNDFFEVGGKDLNNFNLIIVNRDGKPVYASKDPMFKWSADNVSSGVYFLYITYVNCAQQSKKYKGWVQVIKP